MWPVASRVFCYTDALSFRVEQKIETSVITNHYSTTGHQHAPIDNITTDKLHNRGFSVCQQRHEIHQYNVHRSFYPFLRLISAVVFRRCMEYS